MREIKFRGFDVDIKEWVDGSLVDMGNHSQLFIVPMSNHASTMSCQRIVAGTMVAVEPETVGQFTGIHDSTTWEELTEQERKYWTMKGHMPSEWRGREIYEGDILLLGDKQRKTIIEYDQLRAEFIARLVGKISTRMAVSFWNNGKIIGNVHDNPGLLS